jgi:oxygen-dependent protoporphyrinogen oxidase
MKIVVIGGGISGLSAAHYLKDHQVELYEASSQLGGWIQTEEVDGFLFEKGPRTFQTLRCPYLREVANSYSLKIKESKIGTRYLLNKGKVQPMNSFFYVVLKALLKDLFTPFKILEDETIYDFAVRRFGVEAAEVLFDPMAKGIFGGDIKKLSVRSCFPFLQQARSLLKFFRGQKSTLFTLEGGMKSLITALTPQKVYLNTKLTSIPDADLIVLAVPPSEASKLTGINLDIRMEKISVVNLGYQGDILPLSGFGYLVPTRETEKLLGQIWDSSVFPSPGKTRVTSMIQGENPLEIALDAMTRHLNILAQPHVHFVTEAYIPQFEVGHHQKIQTFLTEVNRKFQGKVKVVGNYLTGASVEACVAASHGLLNDPSGRL